MSGKTDFEPAPRWGLALAEGRVNDHVDVRAGDRQRVSGAPPYHPTRFSFPSSPAHQIRDQ